MQNNNKYKVYVDGGEGTTGLRIHERLENRADIELIKISSDLRKDTAERKKLINSADFVFLCLPDMAAIEAVGLAENENVRIIDASTAHRTNPDWAYGLPELSAKHREKIKNSKRVAVPGCYASGFNALIYPLIKAEIMPTDFPIYCHAVSGYSGAGKSAISVYEGENKPQSFNSTRLYALGGDHKHLPEMKYVCGLDFKPSFNPIIDDFYSGMTVSVPIQNRLLGGVTTEKIRDALVNHYKNERLITVENPEKLEGFLAANELSGKDNMEIFVTGNGERTLLTARHDNLGKGASGAAVQCMNIMMGIDEATGLNV